MLKFENVSKDYYLDEDTTITPVSGVNLEVKRGEFVVILGRSGTGKTTLLNLAAGLVKPTSGRVLIDNTDLATVSQKQLSILRSQKIGFVFQFPSLIPALTVMDNITLPSIFVPKKQIKEIEDRASKLLDMLNLSEKTSVYPKQLSAGETKRVVLARSLINQPQFVLADEPTSDLDSKTEKEVLEIMREINSHGVTFLIVTHNFQLVPFATRAFEMKDGKLKDIKIQKSPEAMALSA
jgi:putative ABC transport system ATP-binding protein